MPNFLKDFRCCLNTLFFLFFTTMLTAQPKDNSPYSRIGLGEQTSPSLSNAGFGGLTAGYADPLHINLLNPASYAWLTTATFEAGMYTEHANFKFGQEKSETWTGNLSHLALAFPIHNSLNDVLEKKKRKLRWGMNFALVPNTTVGYDIQTIGVDPVVDTTINAFGTKTFRVVPISVTCLDSWRVPGRCVSKSCPTRTMMISRTTSVCGGLCGRWERNR